MFYRASVRLFVCPLTISHKNYSSELRENFTKDVLWTRQSPLNYESHPDLEPDLGIIRRNFITAVYGVLAMLIVPHRGLISPKSHRPADLKLNALGAGLAEVCGLRVLVSLLSILMPLVFSSSEL